MNRACPLRKGHLKLQTQSLLVHALIYQLFINTYYLTTYFTPTVHCRIFQKVKNMKIWIGVLILAGLARAHTEEDDTDAQVEDVGSDEVVKVGFLSILKKGFNLGGSNCF